MAGSEDRTAPPPTSRRRSRVAGAVTIAAVATLAIAGCTAGSTGSTSSASTNKNAAPLTYAPCCSWPNASFSYNPWNVNTAANALADFVTMRLAVQDYPSITKYDPPLASSWDVSGQTLTAHLQK